jgi:hypothetical protein
MNKNCLILILSGHEVRQFSHSGMIRQLLEKGFQIVVAARIVDEDLIDQFDPRVKFIPLIKIPLSPALHRIQKLLDRTYQIKESKLGKNKWIDQWKNQKISLKGKINSFFLGILSRIVISNENLYKRLIQYEKNLELRYVSQDWLKLLRDWNIGSIITNTPRSEILQPVLIAGKYLDIPRFLFYHSIKDIAGKSRLVHDFSSIGVWNNWMMDEVIRQNQSVINSEKVKVSGCAHFDCVGRDDLLIPEEIFRKKIGANPSSRLLMYPAAVHYVIPDQGRYIDMIINAVMNGNLPEDIQIVIRTNPMDLSDYFEKKFLDNPFVIIQKANWRMESQGGWNFQRYEDMLMFNSLLHYSSLCFGIPSTVTIECAISCLPVLNIGFDLVDPAPPQSMKVFWKAEFYQEVVRHGVAELCEDEKELIKKINYALNTKKSGYESYKNFLSEFFGVLPPYSSKKYIEIIETVNP